MFYTLLNTRIGKIALLWKREGREIKIFEIILPPRSLASIKRGYPGILPGNNKTIKKISEDIGSYLRGKEVRFNLKNLKLGRLGRFQKRVLMLTYRIPRGKVKTYGEIAKMLKKPKGARAVGQALANNPFPIIIPCHRVIKKDGSLGSFKGKRALKKRLLKADGYNVCRLCSGNRNFKSMS